MAQLSLLGPLDTPLPQALELLPHSIARYDDLVNGREEPIDLTGVTVSNNGIELQDREFVAAIREGREPNSSVGKVLDCYRVIGELAESLEAQDGWS